ncbi:DNA-binding protein [Streptomyces otsuchiensis]|uniref:DNA-binding protein n=1 Tax=Streptomyces otsuchiensis TaxID=2681388 RepID=UPI001D130804|nr:DNA-binding protein [Streptomyces otsuchiensis]
MASESLFDSLRGQFDQMRLLGQAGPPTALLPVLRFQTSSVIQAASRVSSSERGALIHLASRYAEFSGWMAQEAGDDADADQWLDNAAALAEVAGDHSMRAFVHVRRSLTRVYKREAQETVSLAAMAQHSQLPPRVRGLAAQHEALGHAVAGDEGPCMRRLEESRDLLARAAEEAGEGPVLGTSHVPDPAAMSTGWCLYDLGRPRAAAAVLDVECARLAPNATRNRLRYGVRRALAHAASGEVEHACHIAGDLLGLAPQVSSATIACDLRALDRELSRFRSCDAVAALQPSLNLALTGSSRS